MKTLTGKVVSARMNKTIVVSVERLWMHPLYKKYIKRTRRYKVHCEDPHIKTGDMVKIVSNRPISKEKHFKLA